MDKIWLWIKSPPSVFRIQSQSLGEARELGPLAEEAGSPGQGLVTWALAAERVRLPRAFGSSASRGPWGTRRARGPRWAW